MFKKSTYLSFQKIHLKIFLENLDEIFLVCKQQKMVWNEELSLIVVAISLLQKWEKVHFK